MEKVPGMFTAKERKSNEDNNFWNMHEENDEENQKRYAEMSQEEKFRYEF